MEIKRIESISDFNIFIGVETLHPLVSVVDFSTIDTAHIMGLYSLGFYFISIKGECQGEMKYGRNRYDYTQGSMIFIAPNQIIGTESNGESASGSGYSLLVHPDLLHGTTLGQTISQYHFFNYDVNEALHLSEKERRTILDSFDKITEEISRPLDKHSRTIIASTIELLLNHCRRFYDRQFISREILNQDALSRFESILNDYFTKGVQHSEGLPTVKYIAEKLALSPNYMSDMIKRETGHSAIEHIQYSIMERAKIELTTTSKGVAEIAHQLGFEYPQYFSRQFKKRTGMTPNEYRIMN